MTKESRTVNAGTVRGRSATPSFASRQSAGTTRKTGRQAINKAPGQAKVHEQSTTGYKSNPAVEEMTGIRRRLFLRIGLAGVVMLALLGGVLLFGHYGKTSGEEDVDAVASQEMQAPVQGSHIPQPLAPSAEETIEIPTPVVAEVSDEEPVVPELTERPVEPPPPPEVAAQPHLPVAKATSASSRTVQKPSHPVAVVGTDKPQVHVTERQVPSDTLPNASLAPPRLITGYALQAGVFADPRRAEELHARLIQANVPSIIEARVQVGPFKTRAEADAARKKLEAMGIDTILLPQAKASKSDR